MRQINLRRDIASYFLLGTALIGLSAAPVQAAKPTLIETSRDDKVSIWGRMIHGRPYEIIAINYRNHIYYVADERVGDYNQDDWGIRHDLNLSPNSKWLFVTRKLYHKVDVGYLYHLRYGRFERIRPYGLRFDEAAMRYFARRYHTPAPSVDDGAHVMNFEQWKADRLIFEYCACNRYDETGPEPVITAWYDFKDGRFHLISITK